MAITDLLFKRQPLQIGTRKPSTSIPLPALVEFDASVTETHTDESEVTEFPVEEGSDISDHVRKKPTVITIEGMISNTPILFLATLQAKSPIDGDLTPVRDRVEAANSKLQELQDAGVFVDVITSLKTYSNMVIIGKSVYRDAANGNVLRVTLTLKEIKIASALTIDKPIPEDVANKKASNDGKKGPKPADSATESSAQSMLSQLAGLF